MRTLFAALVLTLSAFLAGVTAGGKEGKEVKLTGKITCAKCDLGETDKCFTVIVVTKDKKDIVYFFDAAADKKHHSAICTEAKDGSVTGVVGEDGKKKTVTVKELEFKKGK